MWSPSRAPTNSTGPLFEFFRNTALNANEWFFQRNELSQGLPNKRPVLNQNQFGGTIGGPIKKDKLFFFASYQETRQTNGISLYGFSGVFLPPIPSGNRGTCPSGWTVADPVRCGCADLRKEPGRQRIARPSEWQILPQRLVGRFAVACRWLATGRTLIR